MTTGNVEGLGFDKKMIEITVAVGAALGALGFLLGYYIRWSIAQRNYKTIEAKTQKRINKAEEEVKKMLSEASEKSLQIIGSTKEEIRERNHEALRREKNLLKRENFLDQKQSDYEKKEKEFNDKIEKLKILREGIERMEKEGKKKIEEISQMSKEEARQEIMTTVERENSEEILARIRGLEKEGWERYETRAKEILATVVQKCALDQVQEITTSNVDLPNDDIKGRIIGKEGRNIRALEKLTGVEIIVDDTPGTVVISGFDPTRRQIAKTALEKLIRDGRIQPAKIEDTVKWAEGETNKQIKSAGELAVYETGIVGLEPKLVQLIGRLKFRSSYGQNVLLHSVEVSLLATALAAEIGANVAIAKKAGLLHDIGKALDHQVEGSHTEIGARILEKFGVEKEIISAIKSHHEEHPYESLEAILIQTADAISGARPGARKDNLEKYLKRLAELEAVANSFRGIEKSYAIAAGREIRVFVKPEEINDLQARNLAKEIASRIHQELKYPGEIKISVIRESRVIEYAR